MTRNGDSNRAIAVSRWLTVAAGILPPAVWMAVHRAHVFAEHNGLIRAVLSTVLAILILTRLRPDDEAESRPVSRRGVFLPAAAGTVLAIIGILVPMLQAQWAGLLLVAVACLRHGLPPARRMAVGRSLFVLYWAAPFPTRFFDALQAVMQRLSVSGTEWLLHLFNVRVWAEGMVLHSPAFTFEVPAWCSGMRTATTVFILAVGLGILKRIGIVATVLAALSALAYALGLNILRIAALVTLTATGDTQAHVQFLHDATAPVVLVAICLVVVQTALLQRRRLRRQLEQRDTFAESFKVLSAYPPFWRCLLRYRGLLVAGVSVLLVAGVLTWRLRPAHRAAMIRDVVQGMRDTGRLATAARAFNYVGTLQSDEDDVAWLLTGIRIDLSRGSFAAVLEALDALEPVPPRYRDQVTVLRAYALMALGQLDDAAGMLDRLPERIARDDPRVAMIRAELAVRADDVANVATHVMTAARWAPNRARVLRMVPYLHAHRRWDAIAATADARTYQDPVTAFAVLEALMRLDQVERVGTLVRAVTDQWPADPRALEPLLFMAISRPDGPWEDRFAAHLARCLPGMSDPDVLYGLMERCDGLVRPDLLWAVHRRLAAIDPEHPGLSMSAAIFGRRWFRFRRRGLGMPAGFAGDTIDLRAHYRVGGQLPMAQAVLAAIPYGEGLSAPDTQPAREAALREALERFARREASLSLPMRYLHSYALEMAGDPEAALAALAGIATRHPEERTAVRIALSELHERAGNWIRVYETLRDYLLAAGPDEPLLQRPLLRLVEAQLQLHLGPAARFTARETLRRYPHSIQAVECLARAALLYDSPEEALNWLLRPRLRNRRETDLLEAQLLMATQRYEGLPAVARRLNLPPPAIPPDAPQAYSLPPAEAVLLWHHTAIPSERELAEAAARIRANLAGTGSPGLRRIMETWLEAWRGGCRGRLAEPATWAGLGRDRLEQASALHQLTVLLCREERYGEARAAAAAAVSYLPEDPLLQRVLISLSGAEPGIVQAARAAVPESADLWLAALVTAVRAAPDEAAAATAAAAFVAEAEHMHLAVGAMTRAADYLYRVGPRDAAADLMRLAEPRARGLLPAHIMGLRAALHTHDHDRALACTRRAIGAALRPVPPLYEQLVTLRTGAHDLPVDSDMLNALQALRRARPEHPLWAEMLGVIRFQRGGWEVIDALFQMQEAIEHGATGRMPYVIAAEVARLLGQIDRAEDLLRRGLAHNPDDEVLLNNLAYTLSRQPGRADEATALLPRLEALADDRIPWLDTIAAVLVRTGQHAAARERLAAILRRVEPGTPEAFRARMHLAELLWREDRRGAAASILEEILQSSRGVPDEDILEANTLLATIRDGEPPPATPPSLSP